MTYKEYKDLADRKYPHLNLNSMPAGTLTPPECVKRVAQELFITSVLFDDLAKETRKQLISLREDGVHLFE